MNLTAIFAVIDGMPMRQREMSKKVCLGEDHSLFKSVFNAIFRAFEGARSKKMIQKERIKLLKYKGGNKGEYVLYWRQAFQRGCR